MKRHPRYLDAVRDLPCCVPGCLNPSHAHHVRTAANSGIGMKPSDTQAIPCCHEHHMEGHTIGWRSFERKYGIDLAEAVRFTQQAVHQPMP